MLRFPLQNESNFRRRLIEVVCFSFTLLPLAAPHLQAADAAESSGLPEADAKNWHLLQPLWASPIVYRESVLFIQDGTGAPDARLALNPKHIVQIASADGSQVFTEDDYTVDAATGRLTLTPKSRISNLKADETFPRKGSPRSIHRKAGDASRDVLYDETGWFHDRQVEVTYLPMEAWIGYHPTVAKDSLPRTLRRLQHGEPLTIAISGDSISTGDNASSTTGKKPAMPGYPQLVVDQLQNSFHSKITLANRAVGGWRLEHGLKDLPQLLETKPDLVIIAYGMNHVRSNDPKAFKRMAAEMIDRIHAADKSIEIILIAPMYGNPGWKNTPPEQFPLHRDALASFAGPGIALCDVTTLWGQLLERKRFVDLTGNGVNHPNDFGHRLYAQALLSLLLELPPPVKTN
jgi:lysophospholipase L1-like esterase